MSGFDTTYRIRLGNYRVVYIVDDAARVITVTRVGHRRGLPMTSSLVPISEARAHLSRLVRESADDDVVLMNHGRPAAILISAERYESLMEELEDLRDRLSVHEREHVTMPLDKLGAELGVDIGRV